MPPRSPSSIIEIVLTLRKLRHSREGLPRVRSKTVRKSNANWSSVTITAMATAVEEDEHATLLCLYERHTLLYF